MKTYPEDFVFNYAKSFSFDPFAGSGQFTIAVINSEAEEQHPEILNEIPYMYAYDIQPVSPNPPYKYT